jgi:hypothetical protein
MQAILIRAEGNDRTSPGRIDSSGWRGRAISRLPNVAAFVELS